MENKQIGASNYEIGERGKGIHLQDQMKIISLISFALVLLSFGCTQQREGEWFIRALSEGRDESEIRELVRGKSFSLDDTLNTLWLAMSQEDTRKRNVADYAFVRISRGILLSPSFFEMGENEYWGVIAKFYVAKFKTERNEEMKRAAAIYLRQIRRPESDLLADEADVPTLKELTGVELEDNRL